MCGIIGISSNKPVSANIINSLKKLEYRGYDSAGIATLSNGSINEVKSEGRVDNLENNFDLKNLKGNIGIGHVRWATHGIPNSVNAHPHSSENVSVVHNGIIENSTILKKYLINKGYNFKSQTDTEVIVHLITENLKTSELEKAITKTLKQLHGSFALGIVFKNKSDLIVGARRGSPLAVGYGPNENYLGSDSYALKSMTNKITYLDDGEFCIVKNDQVIFFNEEGKKVNKKILELSSDEASYDKGDFKHFMAKEIEEQPTTIKTGIKEYIDNFNNAQITISHDLDAACIAMYNGKPNITCILGTGSNSCFYDGKNIIENSPSLGFIVGDEASGNSFGKKILSLYFNNIMSDELKKKLESGFETDLSIINKSIYNTNRANVFLAKYFPFIIETKKHPLIQKLIIDTLDEFINLHVKCFSKYKQVEINFIGSVSFLLTDEIHDAAKRNNLKIGKILQNPIKKLVEFHFEKLKEKIDSSNNL